MLRLGDHHKGEIEIIEPDMIFENKYVEICNDKVIFPSGNTGTYIRVNCKPRHSVAVLPITSAGKIVVIKNYRHGVRGWGIEVPKGAVEEGEGVENAAKRELEEETGYRCEELIRLGEYSESPAVFGGKIECFVAKKCISIGQVSPEKTEAIGEIVELSIEEFWDQRMQYDYVDALSELMIYRYISGRK